MTASELHRLRNRIAHHEPIWAEPNTQHHDAALDLITYVDPALRDWINTLSTVPAVLVTRPA